MRKVFTNAWRRKLNNSNHPHYAITYNFALFVFYLTDQMYYFKNYLLLACGILAVVVTASAQTPSDTVKYNHQDLFGPIVWPTTTGDTRSASGQPGQHYWQ